MNWFHAVALVCSLALSSCSSGNGPPASGRIGSSGGTIAVVVGPLAGASLSVPPDALSADTDLSIDRGVEPVIPLIYSAVGPAVRFDPAGIEFARPATATVPFPPVPPGGSPDLAPLLVLAFDSRVADAPIEVIEIRGIDLARGRATFPLAHGATCLVVALSGQASYPLTPFLPLVADSRFDFDDGTTLTIGRTDAEPNLDGFEVVELEFERGSDRSGYYLTRNGIDQTLWHGRFSTRPEFQEVALEPAMLLDARFVSGQRVLSSYGFEWYPRYREGEPGFWGSGDLDVTVDAIDGTLSVPLGDFTDTVRVTVELDQSQGVAFERFRWWLARDVGIVQFETDGRTAGLVWGVIDGQPVYPR